MATPSRFQSVIRISISLLLALALTGCAAHGPGSVEDTYTRHKALVRLAVTVGVHTLVQDHPARRAIMIEVSSRAKVLLDTSSIDVMQVLPFALAEIAAARNIAPDVRFLLEELVIAIVGEVQGFVDTVKVPKTQWTQVVAEMLGWIARAAGGPAPQASLTGAAVWHVAGAGGDGAGGDGAGGDGAGGDQDEGLPLDRPRILS